MDQESNSISINIPAAQAGLAVALQRLLDVYIASSIGIPKVEEENYLNFREFFHFSPAQDGRISFSHVQDQAKNWLLRSVVRDAIELTHGFLESCRALCALFRSSENGTIIGEKYNQIVREETKSFHKLGFPDKVGALAKDFGVTSELTPHILSINKLRTCLVHRFGIIRDVDLNTGTSLRVTWRAPQIITLNPDKTVEKEIVKAGEIVEAGWSVNLRIADKARDFAKGESVSLTYKEVADTIFTLTLFSSTLVQSIDKYARSRGIPYPNSTGVDSGDSKTTPQ